MTPNFIRAAASLTMEASALLGPNSVAAPPQAPGDARIRIAGWLRALSLPGLCAYVLRSVTGLGGHSLNRFFPSSRRTPARSSTPTSSRRSVPARPPGVSSPRTWAHVLGPGTASYGV